MSDKYILIDKNIVQCDSLMEWARWFKSANHQVALYERDGVKVSTVFLGLNHAFGGATPILFETMILGGEHDGFQERCTTWEQAEEMHRSACKLCGVNAETAT